MQSIRLLVASVVASAVAMAQSTPARPEFDVASIKPSPQQPMIQAAVGIHIDGAQVRCNYLSLKDYMRIAYGVRGEAVTGPDWIASERFDIAAKIPEGGSRDKVPEMLQTLLEGRFQLKAHRESKEFPVYGIVVAKGGLKLQPLPPDPDEAPARGVDVNVKGGPMGVSMDFGRGSSFSLGNNKFEIKKLTMAQFADSLSRFADRPVLDMTETPGKFDFAVEMTPEDYRAMLIRVAIKNGVNLPPEALRAMQEVSGDSLFKSLQAVGLKLEARKAPQDVLVVDRVSKAPTEN